MKAEYTKKDLRLFALIFSFILALFSIKFCKSGNTLAGGIFIAASLVAFLAGILQPVLIGPLYRILSSVGKIIGFIATILLLSIIFYCVFTPISVILRVKRRDILGLKIDKSRDSYWVIRKDRIIEPETLEKQF